MFIPGMSIPGMLPMSCFLAVCFFRVGFFFVPDVGFDLGFLCGLFIPGMLDISCCAWTGRLATSSVAATNSAHTPARVLNLNASTLFIIPSNQREQSQEDSSAAKQKTWF
jgi:hypothetical protein